MLRQHVSVQLGLYQGDSSLHVINKKHMVDKKIIKLKGFFCLALNYNAIFVIKGDVNM